MDSIISWHLFFKVFGIHFSREGREGNALVFNAFPPAFLLMHGNDGPHLANPSVHFQNAKPLDRHKLGKEFGN